MEQSGLAARLQELVDGSRSENAFANLVGVSGTMLRKYLTGSEPGVAIAARIAQRTGVRLDWLILGEGPKYAADLAQHQVSGSALGASLDGELLGRVVDRVAKVYRELGVGLPDVELGRLAAEKYAEIREIATFTG